MAEDVGKKIDLIQSRLENAFAVIANIAVKEL